MLQIVETSRNCHVQLAESTKVKIASRNVEDISVNISLLHPKTKSCVLASRSPPVVLITTGTVPVIPFAPVVSVGYIKIR